MPKYESHRRLNPLGSNHPTTPESTGLVLEGLTRRFGQLRVIENLSLVVPISQVVGFLMPNGAEKTTAMRAIFGLTALDARSMRWYGERIFTSNNADSTRCPKSEVSTRTCSLPSRSSTSIDCTA